MEEIATERALQRVSWKGIWAGLFVVCAVEVMMQLFGVAVGVSAVNPHGNLSGVSLWTSIWAIISTLSAFFFGGWAASAISAPRDRSAGAFEGALVWAFVVTVATLLLSGSLGIGVSRIVPGSSAMMARMHSAAGIGAAWVAFGTVFLSLVSAVVGGLVGSRPSERRREVTYAPPVTTTPLTTY